MSSSDSKLTLSLCSQKNTRDSTIIEVLSQLVDLGVVVLPDLSEPKPVVSLQLSYWGRSRQLIVPLHSKLTSVHGFRVLVSGKVVPVEGHTVTMADDFASFSVLCLLIGGKKGKKTKPKAKKAKRKSKSSAPKNHYSGIRLSACAQKFAIACAAPFSPGAVGACIPRHPSPPSQKISVVSKFNLFTGTGGLGFFAFSPSTTLDAPYGWSTLATYSQTSDLLVLSANDTPITGISPRYFSLPYNNNEVQNGNATDGYTLEARVISMGVRVTYVGSLMSESGTYTTYISPTHNNVLRYSGGSVSTAAQFTALPLARTTAITREPIECSAFPVDENECVYQSQVASNYNLFNPYSGSASFNNSYTFTPSGSAISVGAPIGLIIVQQPTASLGSFLVEVIQHIEYTGEKVQPVAQRNDVDTVGFETVLGGCQQAQSRMNATHSTYSKAVMDGIKEVQKMTEPMVMRGLGVMAEGYARGKMSGRAFDLLNG